MSGKADAPLARRHSGEFRLSALPDDLDRLETYIEDAIDRVPILGKVGVQKVINGPIPYSPDGNPYIGPAHGLHEFLPVLLLQLRHRPVRRRRQDGRRMDRPWRAGMGFLDPRSAALHRLRDQDAMSSPRRSSSIRTNTPSPSPPTNGPPAGRPRPRALYDRLQGQGRDVLRPRRLGARDLVPARRQDKPRAAAQLPAHRTGMTPWPRNARRCASSVGILDLGGFTKLVIEGHGAAAWLDRLICGRAAEAGPDHPLLHAERHAAASSASSPSRASARTASISSAPRRRNGTTSTGWSATSPRTARSRIDNLSARLGSLVLAGPKAREVLAQVTDADLSNKAFPWLSAREIEIGFARMLALRVNYVGELGWELHVPMEQPGRRSMRRSGPPVRRMASATSACMRWIRCGSRNAIAAGRAT